MTEELRQAIEDEGPNPEFHREVMRRHRKEWPTLWAAIDQLMQADQWTLAIKDGKACATGGEVWVDEGRYLVGPIDGEDQVLPEGIYTLTLIERK